ncbi:23S rRNA (uracil(1939)-C(5))-methyltransferase RlmD [Thermophilibacter sp. ZX-H3]|uniref:23S rRNA (uracil(1939)-C(5))-methyltransferase RlmD n=1 Tax=Atopobiaceae TaxID=1643824 RepID=UPI00143AD005|nr:23S rRNA (uracil(1939)-C(5))-methyltransferase RlmD [Olsenella sp. SW781]NJE81675.1 23S rRNA (uracil(1939)-C(5))-methyltransferase RlmD [Olsenella sp. SW781]
MTYGPDAVAHDGGGRAVFVSGAVAGDRVRAVVDREEDRWAHARATEVLEASPDRVTPACPYAGACGGCPWAALSRDAQAAAKRACVVDALSRVGRMGDARAEELVAPLESAGDPWGYRNKVELAVSRDRGRVALGMHAACGEGVVRVKGCMLLDKAHAGAVKSVAGALSYLSNSHGLDLERVGIRVSRRTRDVEVALWDRPGAFPRAQAAKVLEDALRPTSVVRVMQKGPAKARRIAGVECLSGAGSWGELVGDERMRVSAPSFFQVNTRGAERLVELVMAALDPRDDEEAMDLYCGAGTFTLPLARRAGFVSAVESYGPAVRDLRRNLETAGLDNVDPIGGDAGREFPDTDADVIVVDPPRAGLSADVVRRLSEQPARAIAYVSCDPATLARDLARFGEAGTFSPVRVTPVDLFPQTYHVETVTLLERT